MCEVTPDPDRRMRGGDLNACTLCSCGSDNLPGSEKKPATAPQFICPFVWGMRTRARARFRQPCDSVDAATVHKLMCHTPTLIIPVYYIFNIASK